MRLLFDANLSHHLVRILATEFPDAAHVRDVGLARADDDTIWRYARDQGYTVVSKDSDFHQRSLTLGAPPKFIWLRVGNAPTAVVSALLVARRVEVGAFIQDPGTTVLAMA